MYADHIAQARTQLLALESDLGKGTLLAQLALLETLWGLTQQALTDVSDHVGGLDEFYDALVRLREFLDRARNTLRLLEKDADDLHYSRKASQEALGIARTLYRTVSRDLDHLFFWLPSQSRQHSGAPALDLTGSLASDATAACAGSLFPSPHYSRQTANDVAD